MFRQRGSHCANILTDLAGINAFYRKHRKMGFSVTAAGTLCRAGRTFREVYYWDSYFTMLGLAESGHWDKVADMVANFAHEIDTYGHIPNGNRSYYLSRSQPPFFALMVELLAQHEAMPR